MATTVSTGVAILQVGQPQVMVRETNLATTPLVPKAMYSSYYNNTTIY